MLNLKPIKYYNDIKKIFNKKYNNITKKYISRDKVGSCSYLFKKLSPRSYQDFANKYTEYYDKTFNLSACKGKIHYGRSVEQLYVLAKHYYDEINDSSITLDQCFDDLVNHIIIETYDGHKVESFLCNLILRNDNLSVNSEIDETDAIFGIDITIRNKKINRVISYIQVKPDTTFIGDSNLSLMEDRRNFFQKQEKLNNYLMKNGFEKDIKPIEYLIYNKNLFNNEKRYFFYQKKENICRFTLDELCNKDGSMKLNLKTLKLKEFT